MDPNSQKSPNSDDTDLQGTDSFHLHSFKMFSKHFVPFALYVGPTAAARPR